MDVLTVLQVIISVLLIIAILMQNRSSGLGMSFGGGGAADSGYYTRRGFESFLMQGTIILSIAFIVIAIVQTIGG